MNKIIVMQGIPGSGKSTLAKKLFADFNEAVGNSVVTYSTDDFWMDNGVYRYDPARAGEAHRWNQRRTIEAMQAGTGLIIIDNTNIQKWQAQVYFTLADIYGYEKSVISVQVAIEVAIKRNSQRSFDRRIPEDVLRRMHADLEPLL